MVMIFTCTLSVMAIKLGGMDSNGSYRGIVTLDYQHGMKKDKVSGSASGGGQEIDAIIEIIPYDSQAYDDAAGCPELTELITYDAMGLGHFILSGGGEVTEKAGGGSWNTKKLQDHPRAIQDDNRQWPGGN